MRPAASAATIAVGILLLYLAVTGRFVCVSVAWSDGLGTAWECLNTPEGAHVPAASRGDGGTSGISLGSRLGREGGLLG